MAQVTFTEDTLRYITFFQAATRTTVVDCVEDGGRLIFVVQEGDLGKAIGLKGENIAQLRRRMKKEIHVIEFSGVPAQFVRNVFRPYDVKNVEIEDRDGVTHATVTVAATEKGRAIGRDGKNLRVARDLIARHHPIESVSVA